MSSVSSSPLVIPSSARVNSNSRNRASRKQSASLKSLPNVSPYIPTMPRPIHLSCPPESPQFSPVKFVRILPRPSSAPPTETIDVYHYNASKIYEVPDLVVMDRLAIQNDKPVLKEGWALAFINDTYIHLDLALLETTIRDKAYQEGFRDGRDAGSRASTPSLPQKATKVKVTFQTDKPVVMSRNQMAELQDRMTRALSLRSANATPEPAVE